jgi:photosystem II stability/assembly factor-like uncharacterized protein
VKIANNKLQIVSVPWKRLEILVLTFSFVLLLVILMLGFGPKVKANQEVTADIAGHFETPFVPYDKEMVAGPNRQLFLVDDGLSQSSDDGHFWFNIAKENTIYETIALSPNFIQDQTFFVSLNCGGDDALRITNDGGRNWHSPAEPISGCIYQIVVSPAFAHDNTVFALVVSGEGSELKRSQDGGNTWQTLSIFPVSANPLSIVISPSFASDRTLLLTMNQDGIKKLMRSNDAGDTWSFFPLVLDPDDEFSYITPAFSPNYQNDSTLFLHTDPYDNLYKSENDGQSWHKINEVADTFEISPDFATSQSILIIQDSYPHNRLLRSTDSGDTWQTVFEYENIEDIAYAPDYETHRTVYVRLSYQIGVSKDGGVTWHFHPNSPVESPVPSHIVDISSHPAPINNTSDLLSLPTVDILLSPEFENDGVAFVYWKNAFGEIHIRRTTDFGMTWSEVIVSGSDNARLAISPNFGEDHAVFLTRGNILSQSFDLGENWVLTRTLPITNGYFSFITLSPNYANDTIIFVGTWGQGVYRSTDDGTSWEQITTEETGLDVADFEISPNYPADPTLFASTYTGVYRSDNDGVNWITLTTSHTWKAENITLSPFFYEDDIVFITPSSDGLWHSNDKGASWTRVAEELFYSPTTMAISPKYNIDQTIIVDSENEIPYISEDNGNTWTPLSNGIGTNIDSIAITYLDGLLTPFATIDNIVRVYRYRWPKLNSAFLCARAEPGSTNPITLTLPLIPDDYAPVQWEVNENADWFSVTPTSGILPANITVTVDPSKSQTNTSDTLTVEARWSYRQIGRTSIPIMLNCWDTFLPTLLND